MLTLTYVCFPNAMCQGGEVGDLANRLVEAEKALALKQDSCVTGRLCDWAAV